jgi:hypothetical protein
MQNKILIALGVILVGLILVSATQAFRLIFEYKITNDQIIVLLFHVVPVYIIPFDKFEGVHEATFLRLRLSPACIYSLVRLVGEW